MIMSVNKKQLAASLIRVHLSEFSGVGKVVKDAGTRMVSAGEWVVAAVVVAPVVFM